MIYDRYAHDLRESNAKELAEKSNCKKGSFLANTSGEIKTLMNAILNIVEIQLQKEDLSMDSREAFDKIHESGNLLLNILNNITDISEIESDKLNIPNSGNASKRTYFKHEYMPYGSVLVVDDVSSNIYVAKGLLMPYSLQIDSSTNAFDVIDKIKHGIVYDVIFMDHMMPKMNGIEAVKIIRDLGYTKPIIALTANAVTGQSEMFLENGFNGFISKPINPNELNNVLIEFILNEQPLEVIEAARKEQASKEAFALPNKYNISGLEIFFINDAEKSVAVLKDVYTKMQKSAKPDEGLFNSYTITVHGIKTALANIEETELSNIALELEKAGHEQNILKIKNGTPNLISLLEQLIIKLKQSIETDSGSSHAENMNISKEDYAWLKKKLMEIKEHCNAINKSDAKKTLEELKQKIWPRKIQDILEELSICLLHSAFRKASAAAFNAACEITE